MPTPPAPSRPPAGYDARTVAEAAEILRHQTLVLGVRSRVAAAAGGLAPVAGPEAAALREEAPAPIAVDLEPVLAGLRELAGRLDTHAAESRDRTTDFGPVLTGLHELAARLDTHAAESRERTVDLDPVLTGLHDLAARLDTHAAQGHDLQQQVAELGRREVNFGPVLAGLSELASRLDEHAVQGGERERKADAVGQQLRELRDSLDALRARHELPATVDFEPVLAGLRELAAADAVERQLAEREAALQDASRQHAKNEEALARLQRQADERDAALRRRAAELEQRDDDLRRTEKELRRRDEVDGRAAKERERELAAQASALEKRAKELAKHEEAVAQVQRQTDERAAALRERTADLERWGDDLRRAEKELRKQQPAAPAPVEVVEVEPARPKDDAPADASRNVESLAALVGRHATEFPEQVEEWRWYLQSLRDVADISGSLPSSVEGLVLDVFGPLLARAAGD